MKINAIRPFASTDRKVHVALVGGGSKDGYLAMGKRTVDDGTSTREVTAVLVKGDRGRPATIAPANIESITWHTDAAKSDAKAGLQNSHDAGTPRVSHKPLAKKSLPKKKAESAKVAEKVMAGKPTKSIRKSSDTPPSFPVAPIAHTVVLNWYTGTGDERKEFVKAFTVVTDIKSDAIRIASAEVFRVHPKATSVKVNPGLTVTSVLLP